MSQKAERENEQNDSFKLESTTKVIEIQNNKESGNGTRGMGNTLKEINIFLWLD